MAEPDPARRAELERRFDGPIPRHLTEAGRIRQRHGTANLLDRMAADYGRALWLHLARTTQAWRTERHDSAARHRAHLDAAARSLLSVQRLTADWREMEA